MQIYEGGPSHPLSSLLTPTCTGMTVDGDTWPDAAIGQIDCYGGTLGFRYPEDWSISKLHCNILALGSIGVSLKAIAQTVEAGQLQTEADRDHMIRRTKLRLPGRPTGFAGCVSACVDSGIITVKKRAEPDKPVPPYFGAIVREWAEGRKRPLTAADYGIPLIRLKESLVEFRKQRGIAGRGPAALVTWAFVNGLYPPPDMARTSETPIIY